MSKLNWTDWPNPVDGEAAAYTGPTAEESEFVVMPPHADNPRYLLMRRSAGAPCGFADVSEHDTLEEAKAAAS